MHFVTSSAGEPHVQSYNFAHMNAGIVGNGAYLLQVRDRMAATMVNSNTLRILGGDAVCCGRHIAIDEAFEEVNIDNGVPGYSRIDLVVAHIETAPQETLELRVIKGEETTGTPVVPGHIDGDLNDGDTVTEMPICSVRIDGINPQEPVSLLRELTTLASLKAECDEHWDSLSQDTGWVKIYETADNRIRARRAGGTVFVRGEMGAYEVAAGAWRKVTTLPGPMAPDSNAYWRGVGVDLCLDAQGVLWARSAVGEAVWSFDHTYPAAR